VGRTEYLNDPAAPEPNSLVPAAQCGVRETLEETGVTVEGHRHPRHLLRPRPPRTPVTGPDATGARCFTHRSHAMRSRLIRGNLIRIFMSSSGSGRRARTAGAAPAR
jgi:hypothetical protein